MLALAKLGEPAIPAIAARVRTILKAGDSNIFAAAHPLIKVLGSMGPAAVPALVDIADQSTRAYVTEDALDEIVRLEPRANVFGQTLSPWSFWRPADTRSAELERAVVARLPRLHTIMERALAEWKIESPGAPRPAAYLLARWGTGETRARGLQVLDRFARSDPYYYGLESIRLLHTLRAPQTADLIRFVARKVDDNTGLKGEINLRLAIALHQLGDRDYAPLLSESLRDGRPVDRMEAARFAADTGDLSNVSVLLPLLDDRGEWDRRVVADVALESLRRLTLQDLPADAQAWRAWSAAHRNTSRGALVARRVKSHLDAIAKAPIWEVNPWIDEFEASDGAALFPLIDRYLDRRDLDASAVGPTARRGSGGSGPIGMHGPAIVTLLLEMTMRGVPGALQRLTVCMDAADPQVRMFGALAMAGYDRPRAIERLAIEVRSPDMWHRRRASEFLLQLSDKRGLPERMDTLATGEEASRMFACRDLRVYTQQPLSCASASDAAAWRSWWSSAEPTFEVKLRQAQLDLAAFPVITPVAVGNGRVIRPTPF